MKITRIEEKDFCRQITADDVSVLQLQLVGGTFVMVTINSQVLKTKNFQVHKMWTKNSGFEVWAKAILIFSQWACWVDWLMYYWGCSYKRLYSPKKLVNSGQNSQRVRGGGSFLPVGKYRRIETPVWRVSLGWPDDPCINLYCVHISTRVIGSTKGYIRRWPAQPMYYNFFLMISALWIPSVPEGVRHCWQPFHRPRPGVSVRCDFSFISV